MSSEGKVKKTTVFFEDKLCQKPNIRGTFQQPPAAGTENRGKGNRSNPLNDYCYRNAHSKLSFGLQVAFTNADGILNKLPELQHYLASEKPDILAVVESNCTDSIPNTLFNVPSYKICRLDNLDERRGGILAFVKNDLEVKPCQELTCSFKESSWSWIYMSKTSRLLLGILYRKPSSCRTNDEKMIRLLEKAAMLTNNLLVCGDFNLPDISWKDCTSRNKYNGGYNTPVEMLHVIQTCGLNQHVRQFTRARGTNQLSLLDLLITSQADNVDNLETWPPLGKSDHGIIQAEVLLPDVSSKKGRTQFKMMWNYIHEGRL